MSRIRHSRPFVGERERAAVSRVISSGQLAMGPEAAALESELARSVGHRYGIAVSSGTAALYLSLRAVGVGRGDRVVIPTYVCTALLNAVMMAGAEPVLADVDPATANLDADTVRAALRARVRAVIVPHLFGMPVDARGIEALGVPAIEDCAQCVGGTIDGEPVGGLTSASVFSFYATKVIAAGEGGMVATSDRALAGRIGDLREYDNRNDYTLRFNFKLSDVAAALARVQVGRLSTMVRGRRATARRYAQSLSRTGRLLLPPVREGVEPMYYRFVVQAHRGASSVVRHARARGVDCARPVYRPLHTYLGQEGFPGADLVHRRAVSIPIYAGITREEEARVMRVCAEALD